MTQDKNKKEISVVKRNGNKEVYNPEKINKILDWATDGILDVNASDVAMRAKVYLSDGIQTKELHQSLIDAATDLLDEDNINYSKVAARLLLYRLRKEVWGGKNPPTLFDLVTKNVASGFYTPELLEKFSKSEMDKINEFINHNRDEYFGIGGLIQMTEKYLVQNRSTGEILETPQFAFALIAMTLFAEEKENRLSLIKDYYNRISKFKINTPTPIRAGARTRTKSYSSCCLIDTLDTKESLFANITAAGLATCDKYGIGLDLGKLRPINAPIKGGETLHSGVIAWLKIFQETIAATQQGGARRGAGTVTFPIFHPEIMTILELKNNQGTHENRVPHLDYSITVSKLFWRRYLKKEKISLFGSNDAPDLYEKFGTEEFDELYLKYESSKTPRIELDAEDVFEMMFVERIETGRIYIMNIDECNANSPWLDTVQMSNLCVDGETLLLTSKGEFPIKDLVGQTVEVWNGEQWSLSPVVKTGENQKLIKIDLNLNGENIAIWTTEYHKFYCLHGEEIRAKELQHKGRGFLLEEFKDPNGVEIFPYVNLPSNEYKYGDSYCVSEPIKHKAVFNGILTGNCQEVLHALKPQKFTNDPEAEIGVCILGAINALNIKDDKDHEDSCYAIVRSLDNLIDCQEYSIKACENFAKNKRSLGIGINNVSAWLASKGMNQNSPEAPQTISDFMEKQQYFLLKASCSLAKERGAAPHWNRSKYSIGLMPTDMYNKKVDDFLVPSKLDWSGLKEDITKYGLRNMTLSCQMPIESTSICEGATNGAEPITSLVTKKTSTTKTAIVVAPHAKKWKKIYLKKEDINNDNSGIIKCAAAIIKWLDMAMSFNLYYDSSKFEDGNLPLSLVVKDHLTATQYGMKTFYYLNSRKKKDSSGNQAEIEEPVANCSGNSCTL